MPAFTVVGRSVGALGAPQSPPCGADGYGEKP